MTVHLVEYLFCLLCIINAPLQSLLRSSCRFTWGEEEAVGEVVVLAVGGAALTVISRHSGVHSDTLSAGGNLRDRSQVLLRGTKQEREREVDILHFLFSDMCHSSDNQLLFWFKFSCVRGWQNLI